jgi:hypothetical protein
MHDTVAIDMFVVATATFRLLYAVIVLGHDRRRIIHFNVTQNPTQVWLARQMTEAFPWDTAPRYLLRDRDASYGQAFRGRLQAMGIKEVVTAPRSPWQNAYVERVIGSVRRECLDHVIIFDERHLRGVLSSSVTCAACCRRTFNTTTWRELISRSTRIVRRADRYTHPRPAKSSRSQRSVASIIVTSGLLPNLSSRPQAYIGYSVATRPCHNCAAPMCGRPRPSMIARSRPCPGLCSPDKELPVTIVGRPSPKPNAF